jgi:hypothetical protein
MDSNNDLDTRSSNRPTYLAYCGDIGGTRSNLIKNVNLGPGPRQGIHGANLLHEVVLLLKLHEESFVSKSPMQTEKYHINNKS